MMCTHRNKQYVPNVAELLMVFVLLATLFLLWKGCTNEISSRADDSKHDIAP